MRVLIAVLGLALSSLPSMGIAAQCEVPKSCVVVESSQLDEQCQGKPRFSYSIQPKPSSECPSSYTLSYQDIRGRETLTIDTEPVEFSTCGEAKRIKMTYECDKAPDPVIEEPSVELKPDPKVDDTDDTDNAAIEKKDERPVDTQQRVAGPGRFLSKIFRISVKLCKQDDCKIETFLSFTPNDTGVFEPRQNVSLPINGTNEFKDGDLDFRMRNSISDDRWQIDIEGKEPGSSSARMMADISITLLNDTACNVRVSYDGPVPDDATISEFICEVRSKN